MYETSVDTLGHTTRKHQDWFDENDAEILSLLEERRRTHDAFCPNRQETENYATRKQNLNCKKSYEQFKMPGGTRKPMSYNS